MFRDDEDREIYLGHLGQAVEANGWEVYHYCLMTNHVHLVLLTPRAGLGLGIRPAHEAYARHFNTKYGEHEALFGRFNNRVIADDRRFVTTMRYVGRNPVEAGMVHEAADWPWSGHVGLAGLGEPADFLAVDAALRRLGDSVEAGRVAYVRQVGWSDETILARLREAAVDGGHWLVRAVEDHSISVARIAAFTGLSEKAVRNRIAAARRGTIQPG